MRRVRITFEPPSSVFEALHKFGGVLLYGIPEFRLPKKLLEQEINELKKLGVEFTANVIVGKTISFDELLNEYSYAFIGGGAGLPLFLNIKGENLNGVCSANEYLTRANLMKAYLPNSRTPIKIGKEVIVVGAGNVAMDAARVALRLGSKVTILYRRSFDEMPARNEEIHHAAEEGINFELLSAPVEILGENGFVSGVKCIKMKLGELDKSGRKSPIPIKNSEYILPADLVIVALGTTPNPLLKSALPDIELNKNNTFKVGKDLQTSIDRIYAGGDVVTGAATVISAMEQGKAAAREILKKMNNVE